ncbi:hypothetical protein ACTFIZ_010033 [Dictyostelium cf. discoideum]
MIILTYLCFIFFKKNNINLKIRKYIYLFSQKNNTFLFLFIKRKLTYDSDVSQDGTVLNINGIGSTDFYKFAANIPFTLPQSNTINKYSVNVSMDLPQPTNLLCLKDGNCTIGVHLSKSHSIIKTVLLPGDYIIWIFDQTQEKDMAVQLKCLPFSMVIDIQPAQQVEDFLNCQSYFLPSSFNEPGFLDDGGFMYFNEDVYLDLSVKKEEITFNLTQPSYFHIYIPDFRVDIDILLKKNGVSQSTIAHSYKFSVEEEINAKLNQGSYILTLFYFDKNADVFCDKYPLEVTIVLQSDYIETTCTTSSQPDFSNINKTLFNSASKSYSLNAVAGQPIQRYQYVFDKTDLNPQTLASANFTIQDDADEDGIYFFESIIE